MSEPRPYRAAWSLAAALTLVVARAPLAAQSDTPRGDSLLHRIWQLDDQLAARRRSLDSVRRTLQHHVPPVEVRRGALAVRTTPELEARVAAALDVAADIVTRQGSASLAPRLASHVALVYPDSGRTLLRIVPAIAMVPDSSQRWTTRSARVTLPWTATKGQLASQLTTYAEQFALDGVDSSFAAWVMTGRLPLHRVTHEELTDAYLELATSESAALARCRAGDAASCLDVLGIDSLPGSRLARWYAPQDYRALLLHVAPRRDDSVAVAAWIRCREQRDADGCSAAAAAIPEEAVPPPLSPATRALFLREVLDAGGSSSYDRLLRAGPSLRSRFEATAGEPLERTVARWRARIEAARPARAAVPPVLVLASLGWSAVVLGLALIRRSSWT